MVGCKGFGESFWVDEDFKVLIRSVIYASIAVISSVSLTIFLIRVLLVGFHISIIVFNCGLNDDELFIRIVIHLYGDQYHRNRAMVMIWCYMAQMSVNNQTTRLNKCV